jgi:hypothetical protein
MIDYRSAKAREGSQPVMPQGPPVEDTPLSTGPSPMKQTGMYGSIIDGNLDYLQNGNIPIYGSIMNGQT